MAEKRTEESEENKIKIGIWNNPNWVQWISDIEIHKHQILKINGVTYRVTEVNRPNPHE